MQNNQIERKNKYIGFRLPFGDYMKIVEYCGQLNISITDFILSLIYPALEKQSTTPVKQENNSISEILNDSEKSEIALPKENPENEKLAMEIEVLKSSNEISIKAINDLKFENEKLKTEKDALEKKISKEKTVEKSEEKPEEKVIYYKKRGGFLHKVEEKVLPSDAEKIKSLIADGYEKK